MKIYYYRIKKNVKRKFQVLKKSIENQNKIIVNKINRCFACKKKPTKKK